MPALPAGVPMEAVLAMSVSPFALVTCTATNPSTGSPSNHNLPLISTLSRYVYEGLFVVMETASWGIARTGFDLNVKFVNVAMAINAMKMVPTVRELINISPI